MTGMSANLVDAQPFVPTGPWEEPLHFQSGQRKLFGWLHWAAGQATDARLGLVICKPFGFESMCSYLSVRAFAAAATALGIPSMRFDYAGTGDAEDLDSSADQIEVWTQDVLAAIDELRRRTGVERVCLLGFRLGAFLAALAGARSGAVSGLIAVAPVVSGLRYFRELRNFERAAAQIGATAAARSSTPAAQAPGDGGLEVSGFALSAATIATLSKTDLVAVGKAPGQNLLVIDRADLPHAHSWSEKLSSMGVRTRYVALPGFVEMMMRPPDMTVAPDGMIAAMHDWLGQLHEASAVPSHVVTRSAAPSADSPASQVPGSEPALPVETPVFFGSNPLLFGIVTEPEKGESRCRGVVLVNSGGDYHIGPRRMYVSLARRWARRGYHVLRMDLSGLGDSGKRPGRPGNEIFPPGAIDDIRAGVDLLRNSYGITDITVGGLCSGAYHSLQAAVKELPVNRILMVNPLNFFWEEGAQVTSVQPWEVVHKPGSYVGRLFSREAWRRVLTGDANLWRMLKISLHSPLFKVTTRLRDWARRLNIPLRDDLARVLRTVASRGVRIVFVFSEGDAGIDLLKVQSGMSWEALSSRYCIHVIGGADHNFTHSASRATLEQILTEELLARS